LIASVCALLSHGDAFPMVVRSDTIHLAKVRMSIARMNLNVLPESQSFLRGMSALS
jgi:hypothetical protein